MNESANHDPTSATSDGRNDPEQQIGEERIFFDGVSDEQLEAAAFGPIITFTLSIVLFACQFCPSDGASSGSTKKPVSACQLLRHPGRFGEMHLDWRTESFACEIVQPELTSASFT